MKGSVCSPRMLRAFTELVMIRDATNGWIVSGPSSEAPYAPTAEESVYSDIDEAVGAFLIIAGGHPVDSLYDHLYSPTPEPVLNASERAVLAMKVANGWVVTYRRRPSRTDADGVLRTEVFQGEAVHKDVHAAIVMFLTEKTAS